MKNVSEEGLFKNKEKQNAVIRSLEIIGEAVKNIPEKFKQKYPEIPWREIAGTRDKIVHHYFGIRLKVVWDIIQNDLSDLKKKIRRIKKDIS